MPSFQTKTGLRIKPPGQPRATSQRASQPVLSDCDIARFWSKVTKGEHADDCWGWDGWKTSGGYGMFDCYEADRRRVKVGAHRIAYLIECGEIEEFAVIDHLCRNTGCCNPAHLEAVSNHENILRGDSMAAAHARKTHCSRGHELSGDNVLVTRSAIGRAYRQCRECRRENQRRYYAERKERERDAKPN